MSRSRDIHTQGEDRHVKRSLCWSSVRLAAQLFGCKTYLPWVGQRLGLPRGQPQREGPFLSKKQRGAGLGSATTVTTKATAIASTVSAQQNSKSLGFLDRATRQPLCAPSFPSISPVRCDSKTLKDLSAPLRRRVVLAQAPTLRGCLRVPPRAATPFVAPRNRAAHPVRR